LSDKLVVCDKGGDTSVLIAQKDSCMQSLLLRESWVIVHKL
jgi:hypothetical protein